MSIWTFEDRPQLKAPEDKLGFVYEITNLKSGKSYIGKKQMWTTRKLKPLKGKKNKRHKTIETNWATYTSSSNELNEDITNLGIKNFKFVILDFCKNKWELSYKEAKLQFDLDVLLTNRYYNGIINCRIGGNNPTKSK